VADIFSRLTPILRDVFDNDDVVAVPSLTADLVKGWDSLTHIRLLVAIEEEFGIEFSASEVSNLKNIGELAGLIEAKVAS